MTLLLLSLAGVVGAVLRVVVDSLVMSRVPVGWPLGTAVVNTTGSLLLGVVTGLAASHGLADNAPLVLGTGFCGAFTTFSTASLEVVDLVREGRLQTAVTYAVGGLATSLLGAAVGLHLTT